MSKFERLAGIKEGYTRRQTQRGVKAEAFYQQEQRKLDEDTTGMLVNLFIYGSPQGVGHPALSPQDRLMEEEALLASVPGTPYLSTDQNRRGILYNALTGARFVINYYLQNPERSPLSQEQMSLENQNLALRILQIEKENPSLVKNHTKGWPGQIV